MVDLNDLMRAIKNMPNGDDLMRWPSGHWDDDNDTSGTTDSYGSFDDDYYPCTAYEPEEIPDVLGDLLEIDFLKRWI